MSLIKLADKESRVRLKDSYKDMNDNYRDSRPFLERNSGKLIGAASGLGLAMLTGEGKLAPISTLVGLGFGDISDRHRKFGQFRTGDERFKKLIR